LKYRSEIDGLRALAVLPVILFHAGFKFFAGGFVGVDVFFVISGYLITSILIVEIEREKFSLVNFYERRARRILPALVFVIVLCMPVAWLTMTVDSFKEFSHSIIAVSLFASNILFWRESGYFEAAAEEKPLLHTWSLAVEEQYYLIFPLLLMFAWRQGFKRERLFLLIAFIAAMSLLACEWGYRNSPSANFYLAPFRGWELLAGSLAAFIVQKHGVRSNNVAASIGLIMVLYATFFFDSFVPFPSFYTLVPVLGVVLIVLFADTKTLVGRLLGLRLFVGIGLISYSAYLWHQPIFAFTRILSVEEPSHGLMLSLSLLTMLLAYGSWKYVETPFRFKDKISRKSIFTYSCLSLIGFIVIGASSATFSTKLNPGRFNTLNSFQISEASRSNTVLREESWRLVRQHNENELWFDLDKNHENALIIGNSHSKDLYNVLVHSKYNDSGFSFARYGTQISSVQDNFTEFRRLPNFVRADTIIIASRYDLNDIASLEFVIEKIIDSGKGVILVNNIHEFPEYRTRSWTLAEFIAYDIRDDKSINSNDALAYRINTEYFNAYSAGNMAERKDSIGTVKEINEAIDLIAKKFPEVTLLDRMDYVCKPALKQCSGVNQSLEKLFYDYGHHTLAGAKYFGEEVSRTNWLRP
jgi:peptidoglycan/LPS O-acetylase OafA/YrhL